MFQSKGILISILLLCVAFFMLPKTTYACNMPKHSTAAKSCCKVVNSDKECCKKKTASKVNKHNDCSGQCGHCKCNIFTSLIALPSPETKNLVTLIQKEQLVYCYHKNDFLPLGFYFIWLPPKIS